MSVLETQKLIIEKFSRPSIDNVVNKIVRKFQKLNINLSGIEKANTWDEICIQMQSEFSIYWSDYEDAIIGFIENELDKLSYHEKMAIWFQSETGQQCIEDELFNLKENESIDYLSEPGYNQFETTSFLTSIVLKKASNWSNQVIRNSIE